MQQFIFETLSAGSKTVNVASVPQRSPFRYPGGKTWFVPQLRNWLLSKHVKPKILIEPFAGGGIVSLTAVMENLAAKALMTEIDPEVAAVWHSIIGGDAEWLADRITKFEMTRENVVRELQRSRKPVRERAFQTILKNRTYHGGILASGSGLLKSGEGGRGVLSRWYPETLARRIRNISAIQSKLSFLETDAFDVISKYNEDPDVVFFIDPPYTAGGKKAGSRLYTHYKLDHEALFSVVSRAQGDFIMTYDNADEVRVLARKYGLQAKPIPMKSTHHAAMTELVIGKDLTWMSGINRVLDRSIKYSA